jgi:hypothetical protein
MASNERSGHDESQTMAEPSGMEMPRPTIWPMVLALGLMLLAAGLLTNLVFSVLGAILSVVGLGGWIGQFAPGAGTHREALAPEGSRPTPVRPSAAKVAYLAPGRPGYRARIPERVHPYRAGLRGGIAGGVVMALTAALYGLISDRGVWYPINLLAAMVLPEFNNASLEQLEAFSLLALVTGLAIHAVAALSVGLLMAVIMPMLPRGQFIWGSLLAPLLWTGATYGFMGVLNPVMDRHVDWGWFIASQFAYGIAAVVVILWSEEVEVGAPPPSQAGGGENPPAHDGSDDA